MCYHGIACSESVSFRKNDELDKPGRLKCLPGLSSSFFIRKEERNFGYGPYLGFCKKSIPAEAALV